MRPNFLLEDNIANSVALISRHPHWDERRLVGRQKDELYHQNREGRYVSQT